MTSLAVSVNAWHSCTSCRDTARVPIHADHRAERLKPERVGQALEQLGRALLDDDPARDLGRELDHALEQPARSVAAVQG